MKAKFQIDQNGNGYVALIDPSTKEHKKAANLSTGQEVVLTMPGVTDASEVDFSDVSVIESTTQTPESQAPPQGEGSPDKPQEEPQGTEGGPTDPESPGPNASDQGAGDGQPDVAGTESTSEGQTTSAVSALPLYVANSDDIPDELVECGLETPDGKTLYHYTRDVAGEAHKLEGGSVEVYAEADDNEQIVCPVVSKGDAAPAA